MKTFIIFLLSIFINPLFADHTIVAKIFLGYLNLQAECLEINMTKKIPIKAFELKKSINREKPEINIKDLRLIFKGIELTDEYNVSELYEDNKNDMNSIDILSVKIQLTEGDENIQYEKQDECCTVL